MISQLNPNDKDFFAKRMLEKDERHMSQFRQAMLYVATTPACGNTGDRQWQTRKSVFYHK
jgi:hypothetical protein